MPTTPLPAYICDILDQPATLRAGLRHLRQADSAEIAACFRERERIVLTGMGASYAALLPAWRSLVQAGFPAWHLDTVEVLSLQESLITPRTVVIAASQSGYSAELVALAERMRPPAALIALTNDPASPLARASIAVIEIHSGVEHAVSTRSYLNTLAAASSMTPVVTRGETLVAWDKAADAIEAYLQDWRAHVEAFRSVIGPPQRLVILGRGASMAAAHYGALIMKEAAKWPVEAMNSAQFRHGPLELADERLTALVLPGEDKVDHERNLRLAQDIVRLGGRAVWLDNETVPNLPHLPVPGAAGPAAAAVEAVPLQLLSVALAEQQGIEPGVFRHLQKVTVIE